MESGRRSWAGGALSLKGKTKGDPKGHFGHTAVGRCGRPAGHAVRVCSGCDHRARGTGQLTWQVFTTHSSGGWTSKCGGPAPAVSVTVSPCVLMGVSLCPQLIFPAEPVGSGTHVTSVKVLSPNILASWGTGD